jgi:hypothetical protein
VKARARGMGFHQLIVLSPSVKGCCEVERIQLR